MKKYLWIMLLIAIFIIAGVVYFYRGNSNSNYTAKRTDSENNNYSTNSSDSNSANNSNKIVEQEIASFSTEITNTKDINRQGNITITCSTLTNTIVEPGNIFSFCDTVGQATVDKGYKDANIIIQGTETKGLGGGNCQISSTLYNAVLAVSELEVIERHPHSAPVPYIEEGKDAAVSYGSHDFKFKNNTDSSIKIIAENTIDQITIKLIKLIKE